jgi:hypothetical protein
MRLTSTLVLYLRARPEPAQLKQLHAKGWLLRFPANIRRCVDENVSDKHTSLRRYRNIYGRKKFNIAGNRNF